jgi:chromate reductase
MNVLGISGSLRKGSFNTATLHACKELAPQGMTIEVASIGDLPHYSADIDGDKTPEIVRAFKDKVRSADAVLFVSPEYNYSIPGPLKNAIDWASRSQQGPQAFHEKPVAIMGASIGAIGTARMQYHLRQVCVFLNAHVLNKPEVMIGKAQDKFDAEGRLTDEPTRKIIAQQLEALVAWTQRLKQ